MTAPRYASPADPTVHGEYRIVRRPGDDRPLYRFTGRITEDGSSGFRAEPGRYHLYAGWFCPWSQRVTLEHALHGLEDVVSVSYVDDSRDGRGWAFRETHGPDPVNGFTLLREAYEATEPGFDGHISVPTLWDRETGRVVSNDYPTIGIDLATRFRQWDNGTDTYPEELRAEIEELDGDLVPTLGQGLPTELLDRLEARLTGRRFLVGEQLTEADVRLWVHLARHAPGLEGHPAVRAYARDLHELPAFTATTDFATFTARRPAWSERVAS
ncbi:hypothetical protein GCM10009836_35540 [Pseudonocardia ailaonensis]|uniref:GST C-terminal domain-containing protein n=1 Tax=Pseudonocardia ailaonensis TaxID=367279 RepID=A0ABN2N4Z6_9PSEU